MNANDAWVECYLGLGSNLNNPVQQLISATEEVANLKDVTAVALSPLYGSRPVGPQDQPDYVNAVMRIKTRLPPQDLLKQLQGIENTHARLRLQRWGARTLDLDILLYNNQIIDLPDLTIPHPELAKRAFVLYPLADIAPADLLIPGQDSLNSLLAACPAQGIQRLASS